MAGENTNGGEQAEESRSEKGSGAQVALSTTDAAEEMAKMDGGEAKAEETTEGAEAKADSGEETAAKDGEAAEPEAEAEESDKAEDEKAEDEDDAEDDGAAEGDRKVPYERLKAEVGKRHEAEERAQKAEARVAELDVQAAAAVGLHPSYLSKAQADLIQQANGIEAREEFLFTNLDGFENNAKAKELGLPESMTAQQVKERYVQVRRESSRVVPQANAIYQEQLKQQLADMEAGRKLRLGEKKPAAAKPATDGQQKPKLPVKPGLKVLPKSVGASSRPVTQPAATRGFTETDFKKAGGGREGAAAALASM